MRHAVRLLFALLVVPAFVLAQNPSDNLTPAQKSERLDQILKAWEGRMGRLDSLSMKVHHRLEENVRKKVVEKTGVANLLKPDLSLLHLADPQNPNDFERYVSNAGKLYRYDPKKQVIEAITLLGKYR